MTVEHTCGDPQPSQECEACNPDPNGLDAEERSHVSQALDAIDGLEVLSDEVWCAVHELVIRERAAVRAEMQAEIDALNTARGKLVFDIERSVGECGALRDEIDALRTKLNLVAAERDKRMRKLSRAEAVPQQLAEYLVTYEAEGTDHGQAVATGIMLASGVLELELRRGES
jgi:hypothetical protein